MTWTMTNLLVWIGTSPALSVVVKATALLVLAMLAARIARRARASLRHALLAAAFAAILALPVLTILLPSVRVPISSADARASSSDHSIAQLALVGQAQAATAPVLRPRGSSVPVASLLWWTWAIGACLTVSPVVVALYRLRHLRRTAVPALQMVPVADRLLREASIRRRVEVVVHEDIHVPMTFGIARPMILLPMSVERWTAEERRYALVHELEHIRRSDCLVHLVARLACSVYWFHPLAWAAWRQMTLDAEHACDDMVVLRADRTDYAHHLVALAERIVARPVTLALSMARRRDLSARVSAILNEEQARGRVGVTPGAVIVGTATAVALAVSVLQAVEPAAVAAPSRFVPAVAAAQPAFDTASIKASTRDASEGCGRYPYPTRVEFLNCTVKDTVVITYGLQPGHLVGGPDWLASKRFDIIATSEAPFHPLQGLGLMRQLLADRFNLRMRIETQSQPIYVLQFARSDREFGPNLRVSKNDAACTATEAAFLRREQAPQPRVCQPHVEHAPDHLAVRDVRFGSMVRNELSHHLDRPVVVDETGLTNYVDFELSFAPIAAADGDDRLFDRDAVDKQLGLKLVPETRPIGVMVIDSVAQPATN